MNQSKEYNEGYDFYWNSDGERVNPYAQWSVEALEWERGLKEAEKWDKARTK